MCFPVQIVELERPLQNIAMPIYLFNRVTRIWNANNFLRTFKRNLFPESSNNFVQLETNENLALPPMSMARCSQGSRGWAHLGFTQLSSPHWGLRKAEDESLGYIRWRACLLCANDGAWWRPVFGQHAFSFPHTFVITITACSRKGCGGEVVFLTYSPNTDFWCQSCKERSELYHSYPSVWLSLFRQACRWLICAVN